MNLPAQNQASSVERLILFLPTQHALRIGLPFDPPISLWSPYS